jgi:2-keto-myo-inositol isomerase
MVAPRLGLTEFFQLAASLAITEVEIRNDLHGRAIGDGTRPETVRAAAAEAGVTIVSINALQRFDHWTAAREREAIGLARYASASGARALVLVPVNDGRSRMHGDPRARLRRALEGLRPVLADHDVLGLVEPLGFATCSLRSKREAADAIGAAGGRGSFQLVHDTFHHALAGEADLYPALTGLVHVSGVTDHAVALSELRDSHRVLLDAGDRLDAVGQIKALRAAGYSGPLSFEPFAAGVHGLAAARAAIAASRDFLGTQLVTQAA